jgi:hypothetical protein
MGSSAQSPQHSEVFILRKTPTVSIFMNTTDEANDRKSAPVETQQLFAANDMLNRELDRERRRRYRNWEPDLEYVHTEFERVCLAEIQAAIAGVIPFATAKSRTEAQITADRSSEPQSL